MEDKTLYSDKTCEESQKVEGEGMGVEEGRVPSLIQTAPPSPSSDSILTAIEMELELDMTSEEISKYLEAAGIGRIEDIEVSDDDDDEEDEGFGLVQGDSFTRNSAAETTICKTLTQGEGENNGVAVHVNEEPQPSTSRQGMETEKNAVRGGRKQVIKVREEDWSRSDSDASPTEAEKKKKFLYEEDLQNVKDIAMKKKVKKAIDSHDSRVRKNARLRTALQNVYSLTIRLLKSQLHSQTLEVRNQCLVSDLAVKDREIESLKGRVQILEQEKALRTVAATVPMEISIIFPEMN